MAIYQIELIYGTNTIETGISSRVVCMRDHLNCTMVNRPLTGAIHKIIITLTLWNRKLVCTDGVWCCVWI